MRLHNERCIAKRNSLISSASDDKTSKAEEMTIHAGSHDRNAQHVLDYTGADAGEIYDFDPDDVVIACGMARYEGDRSVAAVFDRADLAMYENKQMLKGNQTVNEKE